MYVNTKTLFCMTLLSYTILHVRTLSSNSPLYTRLLYVICSRESGYCFGAIAIYKSLLKYCSLTIYSLIKYLLIY